MLGVGDRDQLGLALHGGAHQEERRMGPGIARGHFAIEIDALANSDVQTIGVSDGQRPQQHRIDEAEGRGAGADGESEREDGRGGSDLIFLELAPAENGVGAEGIEPGEDAEVVGVVELAQRGAERLAGFGGVTAMLDSFLDVGLEFVVDFAVQAVAAEYVMNAR